MDALTALEERRSIRRYRPDPVPEEAIRRIVRAGSLAATADNVQPWEFVVVRDAGRRREIAGVTDRGRFIADAPVCIAVFARETPYYLEDGSAATQNMLVAARALGLGTCWIAGDKRPYAGTITDLLGAPPGYKLVSLVSLGHPAEVPDPPKRTLEDVIHWERF